MKTYKIMGRSSFGIKGKGKKKSKPRPKQVQPVGEWVDVAKVIKTPNTQIKADAIAMLRKNQALIIDTSNFFAQLEKLQKEEEQLEDRMTEIAKQQTKLAEDTESAIGKMFGDLLDSQHKLNKAQWVIDPTEEDEISPFGNVLYAFEDLCGIDYSDAVYSWNRKSTQKEFEQAQKLALKFLKKLSDTLKETKKPFVYNFPVFKETKKTNKKSK